MLQVKNYSEEKEDIYVKIENEGVIMSIGDGIAKACGLRGVTAGEMVIMGNKSVKGMALNLEHDRVGSFFGNDRDLKFASILKNQLNMDIIIKKTKFVFLILPDFWSLETYFFFVSLCVLIKLIFYCFFQYEKNLTVTVLEVFRFLSIYFGLLLLFFYMHEYISSEMYFAALIEKIQFLKIVLKIVLRAYVCVVIVFNYELLYQVFNDINKFFFYWFDNKLERRLLWHIIFILNYCYIAFIEYLNSFFSFPWVVIVGAFIYLLISMYYIKKSKQYVVNVALKEIIESEKVKKKTFSEKKNGFGNKRFFTKKALTETISLIGDAITPEGPTKDSGALLIKWNKITGTWTYTEDNQKMANYVYIEEENRAMESNQNVNKTLKDLSSFYKEQNRRPTNMECDNALLNHIKKI